MLSYDFLSKILCHVMLCLWWHELKSKILWYVMLVKFVSKILCSVMNLTIVFSFSDYSGSNCQDQLGKRVWKVLLYSDVACFLVVLNFSTHMSYSQVSINELARLTVFSPLIETWEYPWHVFTNSQPCAEHTPITQYALSAICLRC